VSHGELHRVRLGRAVRAGNRESMPNTTNPHSSSDSDLSPSLTLNAGTTLSGYYYYHHWLPTCYGLPRHVATGHTLPYLVSWNFGPDLVPRLRVPLVALAGLQSS
jgi:hypothetical protein